MSTSDLTVGALIADRYRLLSVLGAGGMGQVWRALDEQLGRDVALKALLPHVMVRPDAVARLEREARIGAGLTHQNVVGTLDFGHTPSGVWYVVMQLVTGGDLLAYKHLNGPLSTDQIIHFGYQIADALAAAHALGVVHRDLKPENILLDSSTHPPTLRVADFGLAYNLSAEDPRQGRLTVDGTVGGTPEYMSPEQATAGTIGPPADIYSLGCLLFELATGDPPFTGGGVGRILAQQLYTPPPRLRDRRSDLPAVLDELVDRMLAKSPADRPTAVAVRRRLAAFDASSLPPDARGRDLGFVSNRAERMLTEPDLPPTPAPSLALSVAIDGDIDREILGALVAAGIDRDPKLDGAPLVLVLGATLERIALACASGAVVLADSTRADFSRISDLLRLGVAEIVFTPLLPSDVVRRVTRASRRVVRNSP